jgi:DNA polymerase-3 subunit gamma/tau
MSYLVTARKYRPQTFNELIGQEHIAETLKNAIEKGRVGHAYLFSGPRGVGKTSAARIFAKALNCEKGPTPNPCGTCIFCREITEGRSLDLVEIDGASNRRIDEVRQLRENVRFVPTSARYKIYIIDEIHMLTTEAFNALLKTLEEPPDHVMFIFATTEIQKVPLTIRSRCQQFVFKRIPVVLIIDMLKKIVSDFKVTCDEKALFWIARNAAGSMRDAESILDQMISYSGGNIQVNDVFYVLGMPGYDVYHSFAQAIADEDYGTCITQLDSLVRNGTEVQAVITGLIDYFKNAYILSTVHDAENVDLPPEDIERIRSLAGHFSSSDLQNLLLLLSRLYLDTRNSDLVRELFEITLIKMTHYKDIIQPIALVERLEKLKGSLAMESHPVQINKGTGNPDTEPRSPESGRNRSMPHYKKNKNKSGGNTKLGVSGKDVHSEELSERIIHHFTRRRIALSEFLKRAKSFKLKDGVLVIQYDGTENHSFEHVSEPSAKRYIEKQIRQLLGVNRVVINIERKTGVDTVEEVSPEVSKVLEIFKGEIVPNINTGGGE